MEPVLGELLLRAFGILAITPAFKFFGWWPAGPPRNGP